MIAVLDTNHFTELIRQSPEGSRLLQRLREREATAFTTVVNAQEVTEGWCACINRQRAGTGQVRAYAQFKNSLQLLVELSLLDFDAEAAAHFHRLQASRLRIGTMDLKIAAICLAHDTLLLSRNLRDFQPVPGLNVENWLD